jgi:hypothetical protein
MKTKPTRADRGGQWHIGGLSYPAYALYVVFGYDERNGDKSAIMMHYTCACRGHTTIVHVTIFLAVKRHLRVHQRAPD